MSNKRKFNQKEIEENSQTKVVKKPKQREAITRDIISPIPRDESSIKIISWNIPGLRSAIKNHHALLLNFFCAENPDIVCLQETKIQETHIPECTSFFDSLGFDSFWACSIKKKGYSGTAILIKKSFKSRTEVLASDAIVTKQTTIKSLWSKDKKTKKGSPVSSAAAMPLTASVTTASFVHNITCDVDDKQHGGEGRLITVELEKFYLICCYVPNSGQALDRLEYRLSEWDPFLRNYLRERAAVKPVILAGDLNVGHLDIDIHNPSAKHIVKQAGLTPQERQSFGLLLEKDFKDAFRFFYPDAKGQFTYWSQRTSARAVNCGLRLDYFVCSDNLFGKTCEPTQGQGRSIEVGVAPLTAHRQEVSNIPSPGVMDCYSLPSQTEGCSDHCPIVLIVRT